MTSSSCMYIYVQREGPKHRSQLSYFPSPLKAGGRTRAPPASRGLRGVWAWLASALRERMAGLRLQLLCAVLLALCSWSLGSDSEEEMKALEADLLTNMHTSKISKAVVPSWKMSLLSVCSLVNNLNSRDEETGGFRDDELIPRRKFPAALDSFSLEAMLTIYQIRSICHSRAFQHWELIQEDVLDGNEKNEKEEVMKRKIPYILKRQLYENKPRRPYILKRGSYYY